MIFKESKKNKVINFFFPLYPLKIRECAWAIALLAIFISLRIALNFATIPIPQFGISLSLAHTPLMVIGWLFGPVVGLFTGCLTDTICYFIKPAGAWYWMYAIQEPMLGFISGLIGSIYLLRKEKQTHKFDMILFQIIFISFFIFCIVFIFNFASPDNKYQKGDIKDFEKFYEIYRYVISSVLTVFAIVVEVFLIISFQKKKNNNPKLVIYSIMLCFLNSIIFSFIMGPYAWIGYNSYLYNGKLPTSFIKYGYMFYLIPRVVKESFKMPLQSLILWGVLLMVIPLFKEKINYASLRWDYPNTKTIGKRPIWI